MNRYLGTDPIHCIRLVRARDPAAFSLAEDLAAYAGDLLHDLVLPKTDQRFLLAALLFRRIVAGFETIIALAERGLHTDGLNVRRAQLEALFVLGAITKDSALVDTYLKGDAHRRRDIFKRIKKLQPEIRARLAPEMSPEVVDGKIVELEAAAKGSRYMGPEKWANAAGLSAWYLTDYSFLSGASHHAAKDLERHLAAGSDGSVEAIHWGPEPDPPSTLIGPAGDYLLIAADAIHHLFSLTPSEKHKTLRRTVDEAL
jgi:Family of unknown function (DUF5677)